MSGNDQPPRKKRTFRLLIIIIALIVIFGIALQVTKVNFEEPLEPRRQENLISLIRELAHPDLFDYENETRSTNITIRMPCAEDTGGSQVSSQDRLLILYPNCATTTQDALNMLGEGFAPNIQGIIRWYPPDMSETTSTRVVTDFRTDSQGNFNIAFTMPDVRPSDEPQRLEVIERIDRRITGLSTTTEETLAKIIETILMALMASTLGTILAIPISFLGARNLMINVGAPLASLMAALIALPFGAFAGWILARLVVSGADLIADSVILGLIALVMVVGLIYLLAIRGPSLVTDASQTTGRKIVTWFRLLLVVILAIIGLAILAQIGVILGEWLRINISFFTFLGIDFFGFIGEFILVLSELCLVLLPALIAAAVALIAASYANRYGQELVLKMAEGPARLVTSILTTIGTTFLIFGLLYVINWICLLGLCHKLPSGGSELILALGLPALIIGLIAGLAASIARPKRLFPIGLVTYTVTRTILNILRAIEPLIMGFVLVVWVGLGPFAGVLALMLHSIADLGKLFSEQVENIDEGPVEAVTATGASKVQTIAFAVVPQVVPHYTAFIFYRWDINVRMSTVIGFVGGGGIGLILFRSTNLTQYQQASVMVIAIAVVVTVLDYVSSRIRKRII